MMKRKDRGGPHEVINGIIHRVMMQSKDQKCWPGYAVAHAVLIRIRDEGGNIQFTADECRCLKQVLVELRKSRGKIEVNTIIRGKTVRKRAPRMHARVKLLEAILESY